MLKDSSSLVKTGRNLISARKNSSEWLSRVKKADVAGLTLGPEGPDPTFLLESDNKTLRFTNIQQASATLSNSKLELIRAQLYICKLYDQRKIVNSYT
jgi:hypothetical protein